jgi:hypothetical protein
VLQPSITAQQTHYSNIYDRKYDSTFYSSEKDIITFPSERLTMDESVPSSLIRDITPPRLPKRRKTSQATTSATNDQELGHFVKETIGPTLAEVEAGKSKVEDHLVYFTEHLSQTLRPIQDYEPRLSIKSFSQLYESNQHERGNHFVIHQHNHPISGVHYDLRLQFSNTSSLSFALPKGVPGNPNSKSLGRMAVETRVHNLWNHLIESASPKTGSLLIWDTGTYSVLPRKIAVANTTRLHTTDDDSGSDTAATTSREATAQNCHENEKLVSAFKTRYIRLRLHGTKLPKDYTVTLRLPSANDIRKTKPSRATKQKLRKESRPQPQHWQLSTDSEPESSTSLPPSNPKTPDNTEDIDTDDEDAQTRLNNAYPGSTNSIGSIHQRKWYLSLDRRSSGFIPGQAGVWERDGEKGFEPFFVRGRDFERSVVTGRLAREVESDEGVEGFVGRAGWIGIMQ